MKRDLDLIRKLLLWAEAQPHGYMSENPDIEGYTEEQIGYHVYLMKEGGLVDAAVRSAMSSHSPEAILLNLTWHGHEFLDAARKDTLWAKAKEAMLKQGGSMAFDVLLSWLKRQSGLDA